MGNLAIGLYASCVPGHHVTRYGTTTLIGAVVDLDHPGNLRFDPDAIVAIPENEYAVFRREYDRLLTDGALKKRSAEEYEAYQASRAAALDKAAEDAAAKEEDKAKSAESKPVPEPSPSPPPGHDVAPDATKQGGK